MDSEVKSPGPMDGLTVIELANFVAAPAAGALMADLGAMVIKVEPPEGDGWRTKAVSRDERPSGGVLSTFNHDNRGKQSVILDLASEAGADIIHRLARQADIFLTNLLPHRRSRFHLTPPELMRDNPRLIYVGVSGYPTDSEDADRPGFDYSAFWAASGLMGKLNGENEVPPLARPGIGDHTTAMTALAGTLAALNLRHRTGRGSVVELSLFSAGLWVNSADVVAAAFTGEEPARHDRTAPPNPLWNTYRCSDGRWLLLTMLQPDRYWGAFTRAMGRPEWLHQPEWATTRGRATDCRRLVEAIEMAFAQLPLADWCRRLDREGLIYAPVSDVRETVARSAQGSRPAVTATPDVDVNFPLVRVPFTISGAQVEPRGPARPPGADTDRILLEFGFTDEELAAYSIAGAFGGADEDV